MTSATGRVRVGLRFGAIAGALCSATMLSITAAGLVPGVPLLATSEADAAAAGTVPVGPFAFSPTSGNSDQLFTIGPSPLPARCPGDSANDGFAVNSFMTPVSNDPATLTYNAAGPVGAGFTQPLFDQFDTPILGQNTAPDTGMVLSVGPTRFNVFGPGVVPPGRYFIGVACTKAGNTESFWASTIEVSEDVAAGGAGGLQIALVATVPGSTTTTSTTTTTSSVPGGGSTTTSTTVAGGTTSTTVAGGTPTTTVPGGSASATVTPSTPTAGGSYQVRLPNCSVGETITFSQPESTPKTVTDVCRASTALDTGSIAGIRLPLQAVMGTATGSFTAAPTAAGSYTITMTGTVSPQRSTTFVIVGASTPVTGGGSSSANTGGSPTSNSTGTIPSTGSSTMSLIVWGVLLLVFGRMAMLLGRKPKVLTGT